jgi:hypothetical protein
MRTIFALLCLFCGSPDDATAENFGAGGEPKTEEYRNFLSELASSSTVPMTEALVDLPQSLKEAIEAWTSAQG